MHRDEYEGYLVSHGFAKIGGGLYSTVYSKPGATYAIKVADGDSWPEYIRWSIEKGYAGTFAPKVYSLKFHKTGFYVAIMERLVDTISGFKHAGPYSKRTYSPFEQIYDAICKWAGYGRFQDDETQPDIPDLKAFAQDLKTTDLVNDLHTGNVMVRQDGSLVVIDPSSGRTQDRFRVKSGAIV